MKSEKGLFKVGDAKRFIRLARKAIEYFNLTGMPYSEKVPKEEYMEKRGVFVTLHSFPNEELRGCIGVPYPIMPLWKAIIEAAMGACRDPRFKAVSNEEMENIIVEISIMTKPEKVDKDNIEKEIEIGKHGLIIKKGSNSGLLLPQVPVEYNWSLETFLEQTCLKAGLFPKAWKANETEVYRFGAQIFKEEKPNGKVIEVKLLKC
ncbi:MAG: TIGR00296 family protein [Candidatus Diapherotrites archaeon]|uniref:Protein DRO07_00475 n=1 Tax=Candidatus Iainarchaeum sp. TaxID=3101447 RepID=A0A497JGZ6_9ARCH|nr:TIGR00296 family protein [Candidatus Diapherotrites archaeon]RLG70321.1 MAG: TIGR00296 family protein [Candidatus Diapherotrites archaeon]